MKRFRIDGLTGFFLLLAFASGSAAYLINGPDSFWRAFQKSMWLLAYVVPQIGAGLLVGGFIRTLMGEDAVSKALGSKSGFRGLVLATAAGTITPGGPFASFPLVYILWKSGADLGALIAYLVSWAVLGLHRIIVWELPFLGWDFSVLRFLVSLPIPLFCGLIARYLAASMATSFPGAEDR